eukprot:2554044-Prorocentrum_lima.AAC.1
MFLNVGTVVDVDVGVIIGALKTMYKKEPSSLTCRRLYACDYKLKYPQFCHVCESRATSF